MRTALTGQRDRRSLLVARKDEEHRSSGLRLDEPVGTRALSHIDSLSPKDFDEIRLLALLDSLPGPLTDGISTTSALQVAHRDDLERAWQVIEPISGKRIVQRTTGEDPERGKSKQEAEPAARTKSRFPTATQQPQTPLHVDVGTT